MQAYGGLRQKALPIPITDYTGSPREREKKIERERDGERESSRLCRMSQGIPPSGCSGRFSKCRVFPSYASFFLSFLPPSSASPIDRAELARENSIHWTACSLRYLVVQLSRTERKKIKKSSRAQKYCEKMREASVQIYSV